MVLLIKNLPANAGDVREAGSIPESGRSPERGHGNPLHYSCLKNPMDRGASLATVHIVTEGWMQSPYAVILEPGKIISVTVPSN